MMKLEELKKQELPVTLVCDDGFYVDTYKEIIVTAFNSNFVLIIDRKKKESFLEIARLGHYKVKPKTKKVVIDRWLNFYPNGGMISYFTKGQADSRKAVKDRLDCIHIHKEYELDEDNNVISIRSIENDN